MIRPEIVKLGVGDDPPTAMLFYGVNVIDGLAGPFGLLDHSIHVACTSPPYWGLRDYGVEPQSWPEITFHPMAGVPPVTIPAMSVALGLEEDPMAYIAHLVHVFRSVRRVLREDGTLWLNLGDSYADVGRISSKRSKDASGVVRPEMEHQCERCGERFTGGVGRRFCSAKCGGSDNSKREEREGHLKAKDLVAIPWRAAMALQADGWYLRSDIIWAKGSCMPESVRDRCTRSHEYVFQFAASPSYFYDPDSIREPFKESSLERFEYGLNLTADPNAIKGSLHDRKQAGLGSSERMGDFMNPLGRNKRTVWNVNPRPYRGAHFATWPPELVETMIKAGSSEKGCCSICGAPLVRIIEGQTYRDIAETRDMNKTPLNVARAGWRNGGPAKVTAGWDRTCDCPNAEIVRCRVLDPFSGSATTGMVAMSLGRDYIGIDLNNDYLDLAKKRILGESPIVADKSNQDSVLDFFGSSDE